MNIEEKLTNLKKEYQKIEIPPYLKNYGWSNLEARLNDATPAHRKSFGLWAISLATFCLLIIVVLTIPVSQAAKPGESLYPIKIASDKVVAELTGNYEASIENRAQEVIESSGNGQSFEEATKQYQQVIDEAKKSADKEDEGKKQELRNKLEEQEIRFQEAQKENNENKDRLEEIKNKTRQIRGEVKGEKNIKLNKDESREEERDNGKKGSNREQNDD